MSLGDDGHSHSDYGDLGRYLRLAAMINSHGHEYIWEHTVMVMMVVVVAVSSGW
jgi:hypothetical protein